MNIYFAKHKFGLFHSLALQWKRLYYALLLQTWQFCDIRALFGEFSLFLTLLCVQYILSFLTFRTCFLVVVCKLGLRVMSSYIGRRHESSNTEQWTCTFLLINIFIDNIEPKELSCWENVWQIKTNRVEWGRGARMKKRKKRVFFFKISFKVAWHFFNVQVERMFL